MDFYLPHQHSNASDIARFGRSFGHMIVCSLTCDYIMNWDEDVYEWFHEVGITFLDETPPMPGKLFGVKFKKPQHAVLFKLRWL